MSTPTLTPQETRLVELVCQGLPNKQIAHSMGLSKNTVPVYLHELFLKTGVRSRTELALWYARRGAISTENYQAIRRALKCSSLTTDQKRELAIILLDLPIAA